jgi:hypothetical protein
MIEYSFWLKYKNDIAAADIAAAAAFAAVVELELVWTPIDKVIAARIEKNRS